VDDDLGQARHLHDVGVAEIVAQRGEDLLAVARLHARRVALGSRALGRLVLVDLGQFTHQISSPDLREMRTLRFLVYVEPSLRRFVASTRFAPRRVVPLPSTTITLERWIGASEVTMPPVLPARPPW